MQIASQKATAGEIKNSLILLTDMMQTYYGKKVLLLVDEYDVPVAKANNNGYYEEMLDVMKGLSRLLRTTGHLVLQW